MLIGLTQKIRDKYKLVKLSTVEIRPDEFFCYHATHFIHQRLSGLLIMNNRTRYSVVLFNIKKKEMNHLEDLFKMQLRDNLMMNHVKTSLIDHYINDLENLTFVKSNNRSILGQLKDSSYLLEGELEDIREMTKEDLNYLNHRMNEMVMLKLDEEGYDHYPKKAMKYELEKRYKD